MILTSKEIRLILERLALVLTPPVGGFPGHYEHGHGYSEDPVIGPLQAKLSIMLQVATTMESGS